MHHLHRQVIAALLAEGHSKRASEYGQRQGCKALAERMISDWLRS